MERFAIKIDKSLRANLYKICRLCGIDNPDKIKVRDDANIVNLEDGEPELWKKVLDCIGLMITKDDKMPQFMCTLCVDKINDFFEFREMCYATDGQTRKLLGIKGEPKVKAQISDPSSAVDFKTEDIKEPIPEITPQRSGRKRRNADLDYSREIKTDEIEDFKPSPTANNATSSSATKKKRLKLSIAETEPKSEPGTKSSASSKTSGVVAKKEPGTRPGPAFSKTTTGIVTKKEITAVSKKRLKTEPVVKENKKEVKPAKMTKLMKKKLKEESPPLVVPEEQQQLAKKKKLELIKPKKLPQLVVKAEKLKKGSLDTKIKEEAPVVTLDPANVASTATKMKSKLKETCSICSEGFLNKIHLDKHVKNTHIPTIHRYHCVQCNETLKKNMEIKNHNLWHKLSKTPFKCGSCSDFSCSIYTYSKHIRDCNQVAYLDSHIPDWHCPDCSENYETTYLFNIHSCVSKKLVCPGCEKSLKWKEDYFKHIPTCSAAFSRIPPYMTSNIQVKNEADLPTSPLPPPVNTLPAATNTPVQPTPSARVTPPQMDSNQCVVIPGNIPIPTSPSKSNRKGKRITKKDLKRFDKLLKSTMTTLVSIKHEPTQGGDIAVAESERPSSSEIRDPSESPPRSPMPCGGDDFHHNDDDTDSADEQSSPKPVGTIKQEIIDEGYRDLYNNIEVNIKHEVDAIKNSADESSPEKKTAEISAVSEESPLAPKPILKLKITKEHGTLNSILMDSPKSEKKKKKKKRKEDRVKSPENERNVTDEPIASMGTADVPVNDFVPITEIPSIQNDVPIAPATEKVEEKEEEPEMPLPGIIAIKKEINDPEVDAVEEGVSCHSTPSIVAASSGSLQISCVSEGVNFHTSDINDEELPQQAIETNIQLENFESEVPASWVEPNVVVEPVSVSSMEPTSAYIDPALSMEYSAAEEPAEEIDIKPRLEDLIPMLQIACVTSGADVVEKPVRKTIKRKRCPTVAKTNATPKIVSVSSGTEAALYHPDSDASPSPEANEDPSDKVADHNDNAFDFSQFKIKEEVVDPGYNEETTATLQHDENVEDNAEHEEDEEEAEGEEEDEELEEEDEQESEVAEQEVEVAEQQETELGAQETDESDQIQRSISKKQAEENAYIANIDFNNLTIKQEKEYIDDGLENSAAFEVEEEEEDGSSDSDSEESSEDSDSESEREYRDLPSEDEEKQPSEDDEKVPSKGDAQLLSDELEKLPSTSDANLPSKDIDEQTLEDRENDKDTKEAAPQPISIDAENQATSKATQLGLQILTVHSEFSCPHLSKKTESEAMDSDDKIISTDEWQNDKEATKLDEDLAIEEARSDADCIKDAKQMLSNTKDYPIPMEIDGQNEPSLETISSVEKVEELLSANLTLKESSGTVGLDMSSSEARELASISEANNIDHTVLSAAEGSLKSVDLTEIPIESSDVYLENTLLPSVCEEPTFEAIDPEVHSQPSTKEELLNISVQLSSGPSTSPEESIKRSSLGTNIVATTDVDQVVSTVVPEICSSSQLLPKDDMVNMNASNFAETQNISDPTQPVVESNTNEVHMMSFDHFHDSIPRSLDEVASTSDQLKTRHLDDTEQSEINQQDNVLNELIPDSVTTFSQREHCPTQVPLTEFDETHNSCQTTVHQNPCDLAPASDVESNTSHASTSAQSALSYHPPHATNTALSYSMDSDFNFGLENQSTQLPNLLESTPLQINSRTIPADDRTTNLDSGAFDNSNVLMDLGSALANSMSDIDPPSNHDRQEFHLNSQFSAGTLMANIPPYPMEPSQFNIPESSYAAFNCKEPCSSNPSRFSEFQDLAPPTAGQLQTCLVNQPVLSGLSTSSLTNLPMLSEEVQNLLNEDTVAVNNFEFNENVLRARSSLAAADPVPNFNDFENLNEIAENNNNANIERELQDELGNVLAVAIADRSNDDEVDENNVMNENRANFDIT